MQCAAGCFLGLYVVILLMAYIADACVRARRRSVASGRLDAAPRTELTDVCVICLETNGNDGVSLPCGHAFHKVCVEMWLTVGDRCPVCRAPTGDAQPEMPGNVVWRVWGGHGEMGRLPLM